MLLFSSPVSVFLRALSLVAALLGPLSAVAQHWKSYAFPIDRFSINLPAEPAQSSRSISTQAGSFPLHAYLLEDSAVTLFVAVCDYGPATSQANPLAQLQGAKSGLLANSAARLLREKPLPFGAYPGLDFESESTAPDATSTHFHARLYLVGSTLYQLLAAYPAGQSSAAALRFLNSFQLKP